MTFTVSFTAYVDGDEMARRVLTRLRELCATYDVEPEVAVVDVGADPLAAESGNVVGVPTVVRESPRPRRRVIGVLDDARRVADALGLDNLDGETGRRTHD